MHLANRERVKEPWYTLKAKLCAKYGVNNGYDMQYLHGKECHSCNGTGMYIRHVGFGSTQPERCWNCTKGWYKTPRLVVLERIKVGRHVFHRPVASQNTFMGPEHPDLPTVHIMGYVDHRKHKRGWLAFTLLFLLFARKEYWAYVKTWGKGWRCSWWIPQNWLYNIMHIKKHGRGAIPFRKFNYIKTTHKDGSKTMQDLPFLPSDMKEILNHKK